MITESGSEESILAGMKSKPAFLVSTPCDPGDSRSTITLRIRLCGSCNCNSDLSNDVFRSVSRGWREQSIDATARPQEQDLSIADSRSNQAPD